MASISRQFAAVSINIWRKPAQASAGPIAPPVATSAGQPETDISSANSAAAWQHTRATSTVMPSPITSPKPGAHPACTAALRPGSTTGVACVAARRPRHKSRRKGALMFGSVNRRGGPNLQSYAATVEQILLNLGVDPVSARLHTEAGFGWSFQRGSAIIEVYVSHQDNAGYL